MKNKKRGFLEVGYDRCVTGALWGQLKDRNVKRGKVQRLNGLGGGLVAKLEGASRRRQASGNLKKPPWARSGVPGNDTQKEETDGHDVRMAEKKKEDQETVQQSKGPRVHNRPTLLREGTKDGGGGKGAEALSI